MPRRAEYGAHARSAGRLQNVKATFFILGWVAERYPHLVRKIAERGHEPACHSYWHRLIYKLTPEEFREDTIAAKNAIEQAGRYRRFTAIALQVFPSPADPHGRWMCSPSSDSATIPASSP